MVDEEVVALLVAVGAAVGVAGAGDHQEVEVLVGFDECIDNLEGGGRVDVGVELTDDEQQFALQPVVR